MELLGPRLIGLLVYGLIVWRIGLLLRDGRETQTRRVNRECDMEVEHGEAG